MLTPRTSAGSVVFAGSFYILGGYQNTDGPGVMRVLRSVECYSPTSAQWQSLPSMSQPRKDPRGVMVIGGCLYIVDGVDYDRDGEDGELEWVPEAEPEPYAEKGTIQVCKLGKHCQRGLDPVQQISSRLRPLEIVYMPWEGGSCT